MPRDNLAAETLNELAMGVFNRSIFTSREIRDGTPIDMVFMGLSFLNDESRAQLADDPPGLLYGFYSSAAPRGINGYPIFFEFGILGKEDTERLFAIVDRLRAATEQVFNE